MKSLIAVTVMGAAFAAGAFEVQNVTARQRWPWNSLIDIEYVIDGAAAGDEFTVDVTATYDGGTKTIVGKTYKTDPVAVPGSNRLVWDFGADAAAGVKAADLRISVTATPFTDASKVYCVIDLSGGKDATEYPVRYTREDPVHTPKDTNDVCKLTELWMKRVHPAGRAFIMGNWRTPTDGNDDYYARLTKDYYIAIFETTQQQWFQLTGKWVSQCSNELWRATRPLDWFYTERLFGSSGWKWPDDKTLKSGCVLDNLRKRSGLATINLPTETQWQFAVCAGPTGGAELQRYRDPNGKEYSIADIARTKENAGTFGVGMGDLDNGSAAVGSYKPNNFGLYDMLGNVAEDCLDPFMSAANAKSYLTGRE